ncbi:CoA pyrophosphatase [Aquimarina sp. ERC-38]|uniref:NUDIX hydrolase n=1 Tax=Aquimarina sp. ERC-38 TaxID=2949996 RepID=UPI002247390B|nr:CoA pyrophosphatase [Aquimarina sp. ERC-38]UZO80337.1 CoA pyrophosphatase [Aquimarina sp. ERC-38]
MTFEQFKQYLPKIEKMSLPGVKAHASLVSTDRKKELELINPVLRNPRKAGVLLLVFPKNHRAHIVLIQRPVYKGVHSAQIALPGGKVEKEDSSLEQTALRETWEEVGVPPEQIALVREMTKVYIPPSNFWVYPFLGYADRQPQFKRQEEEVAAVLEIPIDSLLDESNLTTHRTGKADIRDVEVPSFNLGGHMVWGATAMMLNEFKVFLKTIIAS